MKHLLKSLCLLTLIAVPAIAVAGPAKIVWKFEKGRVLRYKQTVIQKQAISGPMQQNSETKTVTSLVSEVLSVDDKGIATVKQTTVAVQYKMSNPAAMMEIEYDSTKAADKSKSEHPAVKPVAATVGSSITYKIDGSGKVSSVEGYDKVGKKIMDSMGQNPQAAMMKEMLKEQFSNDFIRDQLTEANTYLADKEVKAGDTWTRKTETKLPGLGSMSSEDTVTYKKDEKVGDRECAQLEIAHKITMNYGGNGMVAKMFNMTDKGSSRASKIWFDVNAGVPVKSENVFVMKIDMQQKGGQMQMSQVVTTTTTQELIGSGSKAKRPATGEKEEEDKGESF